MSAWPRLVPEALVVFALWLVITVAASAGEPFRQVKGKEITRHFSGQEFTDEVHWTYVFLKGGRLSSVSMGKQSSGAWRVEADRLCIVAESSPERCYEVWMSGKRAQLREPGIEVYEEGVLRSRPAADDRPETPLGSFSGKEEGSRCARTCS